MGKPNFCNGQFSQRGRINTQYRALNVPGTGNLNIPDEYEYLDPDLIEMLTKRINDTLKTVYGF